MPTINTHFLPATTGLDLGSPTQQWDLNAQDVTLDSVTSNTLPHATTGVINLGAADAIAWRSTDNSTDLLLKPTGAAIGTRPADALGFDRELTAPAFISDDTSPAATGQIRLGAADLVRFRSNGNLVDVNGLSLESTDEVLVGGAQGLKTERITSTNTDAEHITNPQSFIRMGNSEGLFWRNSTDLGDEGMVLGSSDWLDLSATNGLTLSGPSGFIRLGPGSSSAWPMIKPVGQVVHFRLADDSAAANIAIGQIVSIGSQPATGNGVALQVATADLPAQSAAIGSTTLFTTTTRGLYRLSWTAFLGTAAGVSSTLGPFAVTFFDGNSFSHTITANATIPAGTLATSSTANTQLGALLLGTPIIMYCQTGSPITFTMGYASNPAAIMQYDLNIRLELLG